MNVYRLFYGFFIVFYSFYAGQLHHASGSEKSANIPNAFKHGNTDAYI